MKNLCKNQYLWIGIVLMLLFIQLEIISSRGLTKCKITKDGEDKTIFVEFKTKRIRFADTNGNSFLFEKDGRIIKEVHLLPVRLAPTITINFSNASQDEIYLYRKVFPI